MLLISNIFLLLVNAVTSRREYTILFNRVAIFILLYSGIIGHGSLYVTCLDTGIGIYNGLFHSTAITHSFDLFIYIIAPIILLLTGFYARRIVQPIISYNRFESKNGLFSKGYVKAYRNAVMGIDAPQFTILEYPLIILFILIGAILLMSSSDLVSMFLAIELQSYGLYIFATLYRNSEWSTSAGLTYFLLGGLSSCFILLGSALLYANCGLTSLDGIYVFYNIEMPSAFGEPISTIYSFGAKPEILSMGFLIMSVGYLFKVSAAPFHFWSPERRCGKSSIIGIKLPNSGDTLELLIPSSNRKVISGWINYSCMVISQKASEKNVGYCGSKSIVLNTIVKEQRVYGSWYGNPLLYLRCTLTGFERNYPVKIPSTLIIQRRLYSQGVSLITKHSINEIIKPWFFTGFADAEGCFTITIRKSPKNNLGWQLEANFIINLHKKDLELLKLLQNYLGGRIGKERNGCCDLTVSSLGLILTKLIPHFDKYPLKTQKHADYLLFKEVVMMMKRKEHLTAEGLHKIINIRATINKGLSPLLKEAFPNSVAVSRPKVTQSSIHPQWVAGFTSGDGCFKVSIRESKSSKLGNRVNIIFVLTQHIRDELLLKSLIDFFGCGQAYSYKTHTEFICQSFNNNYEKILPFFRKYPILGIKAQDFEDWAKVAEMIKTKAHLNNEGLDQIRKIRADMNKSRSIE
jgi:hypothetical protein